MKKLIAYTLLSTLLACGSVTRTVFGTTEKNLIKTVAIEQNCSKEKIKIIDKIKGLHGATYSLDVCGKRIVYKQVGSVFMESSKADKMVKDFSN
ncbi:hypothetical protein CW731_03210 [Polaribacter sp. ALD11]|uniref:hypothetical protein n=1 Tax=Polaribacter sp. ALD11 TaxID=2058137 RepID=UPI000C318A74|nr:hypothetical protein [Polaribacter sp. ALD11]AUC84365.1 hypothetical protein CW731_03210 [Polaribacter sp. ALD11]